MAKIISVFNVIKKSSVSSKAIKINKDLKKLVLEVDINSNKPMVCEAVRSLFGVNVISVNIIIKKGKNKRSAAKYKYKAKDTKWAIVTVKEKIEGSENLSNLNRLMMSSAEV